MPHATIIPFPSRGWEPWVDKRAVARHLGVSTRWVEIKMHEGLPYERLPGSTRPRYRLSQVDAWVEGHRRNCGGER